MKITNGELFTAKEPLLKLIKERMPVKTSLSLRILIQKLNEYLVPAEQTRDDLIRKYGKEQNGQFIIEPSDTNFIQYMKEYAELIAIENELGVVAIKLPEDITVEAWVILALEKFVK